MEDDSTVPSGSMQLARVFADLAPASGGTRSRASYRLIKRLTHQSTDFIVTNMAYLVDHDWLTPPPGHESGQSIIYTLTIGHPGEPRKRPGRKDDTAAAGKALRTAERSATRNGQEQNRSATRNASDRAFRGAERSATRSATAPPHGTQPLRVAEHERKTSGTGSLSALARLHADLAADVPDVTMRETEMILELLAKRPTVDSAFAVMPTEIRNGNGPSLVAQVRAQGLATTSEAGRGLAAVPFRQLCQRCSKPHGADPCSDADPQPTAREPHEHAAPVPAGQPCSEWCVTPRASIPDGKRYHEACGHLADIKANGRRQMTIAGQPQAVADSSPYPDDYRDELPEDHGDGEHAA
ncbi:MAG TPA: hypothetical protein VG142_11815 [Trebonia sp.]|nr:hypothetical protein [Trebonia sp.]